MGCCFLREGAQVTVNIGGPRVIIGRLGDFPTYKMSIYPLLSSVIRSCLAPDWVAVGIHSLYMS